MRILIFSTEFPPGPGGIGTHAFYLADGLCRKGHEVLVLTCQDYAGEKEILEWNARQAFRVVRWPSGFMRWTRFFTGLKYLHSFRPEILLCTGDSAVYLGGFLSWARGHAKFAAIEHGRIPVPSWEKKLKAFALSRFNDIVCVSSHTRGRMAAAGFVSGHCRIILSGADAGIFRVTDDPLVSGIRTKYAGARILLTVGNVSRRKGQEAVVRALPFILKKNPAAHYFMIGLPALRGELEGLASSLGVLEHIHFLGQLPQAGLLAWLNACDIFLMMSGTDPEKGDFEGFGIAAVEAALCGKPAVVSRDSGLMEAIRDGETGIAASDKDPAEIASAVTRLLEDDQVRVRMGTLARERALREQTWEHSVERYNDYLQELKGRSR